MTNSLSDNRNPVGPDPTQEWDIGQSAQRKRPGLYLVATPIGNLRDITFRALDILKAADLIYCEDTRVTRKLLSAFGIKASLERCDDHTEESRLEKIVQLVREGKMVALVTDAGTPGISDPGAKLAGLCRDAGIDVFSIPGANAVITAITASGILNAHFLFLGFLSPRGARRRQVLQQYKDLEAMIVLYEAPQRVAALLDDIQIIMGARQIVIARELTKLHERFYRGTPETLLQEIAHKDFKGEIVVMIQAGLESEAQWDNGRIDQALRELLDNKPLKEAVADLTARTGLPRKVIYARALALKQHG